MPFNGSGVFNRVYNWVTDKNNSIDITASRMDTEDTGFATGLSLCLTKDGQQNPTANLPMNGFAHTGVANATLANQYAVVGQVQSSSYSWIAAGGTADAITATYAPALTSLIDGLVLKFRATAANATTTPTFAPNGITARTITKLGGGALVAGDIVANLAEYEVVYNLANTRWELLNPSRAAVAQGGTGAATLTLNNVLLGNGTSAVQFVAPGANLNVLTSNGTTWQSIAPTNASKIIPFQVTDTTDIVLSTLTTQSNIGSTKSITIPTKGLIELFFTGEIITGGANALILGIRIGSTNYIGQFSATGTQYFGNTFNAADTIVYKGGGHMVSGTPYNFSVVLDIEALSIPTGVQTVQVVGFMDTSTITIRGTVATTRIYITVRDHT